MMGQEFRDCLEWLYGLQFFGIKLGLENIRSLLAEAGNPQQQLRIVHVAGTNGKGTTASALASIFHAAGIPAGLYTSPHLHHFSERIRINCQQISEEEIVSLVRLLRPRAEQLRATFFELTTAMALLSFARHGVRWAIVETGMGGRLDATNAVTPELCLLTSISHDHGAWLGESLTAIAAEKAGIFKPQVPVLSVCQPAEVSRVLTQKAAQSGSSLAFEGEAWHWCSRAETFDFCAPSLTLNGIQAHLNGEAFRQNLALALAAVSQLRERQGVEINDEEIRRGLSALRWPGRLEWLPQQVLVDGAHNADAALRLADYLRQNQPGPVQLVIGCKQDKQAEQILRPLLPFAARVYLTCPPVDAAADPEEMLEPVRAAGVEVVVLPQPEEALSAALNERSDGQVVLVAGSLFLVAAAREKLLGECSLTPVYCPAESCQ